jgi:hypothetical protein
MWPLAQIVASVPVDAIAGFCLREPRAVRAIAYQIGQIPIREGLEALRASMPRPSSGHAPGPVARITQGLGRDAVE